jgi:transcriptional regulator with XRE-family HTH domain
MVFNPKGTLTMPTQVIHSSDAAAFARRLRQALKQAGFKLSATDLAHAFNLRDWGNGVTPHATRNWINGVSIPKQSRLKVLCELLQVTPHELLFGPHPATEGKTNSSVGPQPIELADRNMWGTYLGLSVEHRRMVRELTNGLKRLELGQASPEAGDQSPSPD